ncbi:MAG TPA: hypothetical protein VFT12_04665 [Thermoanaerobaculia bacterium]|nr:hypothetical protein [Thermoanaerobaculia bacterium]
MNPEAGSHPVTTETRELAAALRASERSLREFPYYRERYGERGARFGESDSGWLVSLCSGPAAFARQQVQWLGAVLSSRGMPQLLLEKHLQFLEEELSRAIPSNRSAWRILGRCADDLRRARIRGIPEDAGRAIAEKFEAVWRERIPEMGILLVSAVADERNGIERAVVSVEEWAADAERFSRKWVRAVRETIAAAREA